MAARAVAGILVGAALVALFLRSVDVHAVLERLRHLRLAPALLCGIPFLSAYGVRAMRWRRFLGPSEVSAGRVIGIYQVATFLNWLLPVRGGEVVKSLLLRRCDGISMSRSLATVGMDKTMDLLPAVGLLALLPVVHLHLSRPLWLLLFSVLVADALTIAALALAAWRRELAFALLRRTVLGVLSMRLRQQIEQFLNVFVDTLIELVRRPRLLALASGYTVVALVLDALFCLLAFRAVGAHLSPPVVLYGYTLFNMAFVLPTPPGQAGSNELMALLVFSGVFGVSRSDVAAMTIFAHPWSAMLLTASVLVSLGLMGLTPRSAWALIAQRVEKEPM